MKNVIENFKIMLIPGYARSKNNKILFRKINSIYEQYKAIENNNKDIQNKLDSTQAKLDNIQTKLDSTQAKLDDIQTKFDSTQTKLGNIQKYCNLLTDFLVIQDGAFIPYRQGVSLYMNNEIHPKVRHSIVTGTYEKPELNLLIESLSPDDTILELGACFGGLSSVIKKNCKVSKYICVEANEEMISLMRKNHEYNNVTEFEIISGVISSEADRKFGEYADFYISEECWASSLTKFDGYLRVDKVARITLNELISKYDPTYLVCDIEGGEFNIFTEDMQIGNIKKICIEVHAASVEIQNQLYTVLEHHGFSIKRGKRLRGKQHVVQLERE